MMVSADSLEKNAYEDIRSRAIQSIVHYQEEWTNYNASDAGITLLELLAWMQEMQGFYLDQFGKENVPLYLELLGMTPYGLYPSMVMADVSVEQEMMIHKTTRFLTDSICFEPEAEGLLGCERLMRCYAQDEDDTLLWSCSGEELQYGRWMFGEEPKPGNCFYLCYDRSILLSHRHFLYLELELPEGLERNPTARGREALFSRFQLEYWDGGSWSPCTILEDETAGFLQSGCIHWRAEGRMAVLEEVYWLRIRLLACDFDLPPRLREVNTRRIRLLQKETLTASVELQLPFQTEGIYWIDLQKDIEEGEETEVFIRHGETYQRVEVCQKDNQRLEFHYAQKEHHSLHVLVVVRQKKSSIPIKWEATGFPGQVIRLEDCHIMGSRLQVLVEQEDHPGEYRFWKPVRHFWRADSNEECYRFQEETGELFFGDGIHGKIPEGSIILTDCVRTLGPAGSVKEGTSFAWQGGRAYCRKAAWGGRNPETESECMERFWNQAESEKRAVTGEDYEKLVKQTPGLIIQKVKAISGADNSMTLVVEGGYGGRHRLNAIYQREIRDWLEEKRVLGTRIQLESPEYIPVSVHAVLRVYKRFHQAEDWIREAVEEFFRIHMKEFGAEFQYSRLYGILDGLSCVSGIQGLTVTATGKGIQYQRDGSFRLPDHGLTVLDEVQIQLI
ncbi:MAG: hypothetical protein K2N24_10315 [Lachnospiraceae bacterium]|nr:hypothetical protein [Lachnospiraceae bacterium]